MGFDDLYAIGKAVSLPTDIESVDQKLTFILFPYKSRDVINTALLAYLKGKRV